MADYSQKANDFNARLKKGVPKNAAQKGLAEYKAKQAAMTKKNNNSAATTGQKVKARGITRD